MPIQYFHNECVSIAGAILGMIENGSNVDELQTDILSDCLKSGHDIRGTNILNDVQAYDILSNHLNLIREPFNTLAIETTLTSNHPVLAIVNTSDYKNYVEINPDTNAHMVTIVGFDSSYYYSYVGDGYYTAIPKSIFVTRSEIYSIYK